MAERRRLICEAIAHRETDAAPFNFMFTAPARKLVEEHYGGSPIEAHLDFPIRMSSPLSVKPVDASPEEYGETITDEYGVVWHTSEIDRGAPYAPALAGPDLSAYNFPDATAERRFANLGEWCEANREYYTILWVGDLWERATFMRGMEALLLDLTLHPAFVADLLRGIAHHILETMKIVLARFPFDGIAVSDDYGTQKAMLMSPSAWRRFIRPALAEIYALAKANGRTVLHHSCGNVYPIIGDLIDIGLDILHPVQPEAMDIYKLKREFGKDLTLNGGVRTQDLMPYGTPQEVREEVRRLKREMGKGGGYILEPGIILQADVPLENMVALIDETRRMD
ncbi:MAG: uroporphyrinogen decarboxylase family protein [Planctomycetia bacterium]|nr:uroporphyrinogen decarboxylase family protein [Planctomycetia bacterium]